MTSLLLLDVDHFKSFNDEFAIVLPETGLEGAMTLAERFRRAVESASWGQKSVTISVGVATLNSE
jgi:GGDEF domain-containing protein